MKQGTVISALLATVLLAGCASATYKPRDEGIIRFGYQQTRISENEYSIDYYGAKSDSYEKLEELWRVRAEEVCKSKDLQAEISRETYEGKTFLLLPPFVYYDEAGWPLLKGRLRCVA